MSFLTFTPAQYLRIVRTSAAYDLAVTWVFALPWTFAWVYGLLQNVASSMALPGDFPPLNPAHMLMANLLGSVVIVWSLARWLQPSVLLGRLDALARALFAIWQIYAVTQGASGIILAFTVFEIVFGVLQLARVTKERAMTR
jgi:magnesium-transporting ATPase (P-type)